MAACRISDLDGEVYFDDFKVEHRKSPVIQNQDYYPFGLTFNNYSRENSLNNQYQYNRKELQDELDLGWLDYGSRMYQPDLGRWGVIDRSAERYYQITPYSYTFSNPIKFVDPDGNDPVDPTTGKQVNINLYESSIYLINKNSVPVPDGSLIEKIRSPWIERSGDGKNFDEGDFPGRPPRAQSLWETSPAAIAQLGALTGSEDPALDAQAPNDFMWTKAAQQGNYTFLDKNKSESEFWRVNEKSFNVFTVTDNYITGAINLTRSGEDGSKFNINSVTTYSITKGEVKTREVSKFFGLIKRQQTYRELTTVATTVKYKNNKATNKTSTTTYNSEEIIK